MHLILARHGEPERDPVNPGDPGLSGLGHAQAQALAHALRQAPIDALYSSPQLRARETAAPVAETLGLAVRIEPGLVEFDYGTDYVHYDNPQHDVWQRYFAGDLSPWGLTIDSFHARIAAGVDRMLGAHRGRRVLAICHGGVVNAWTCRVLGVPDRIRVLEPAYASLHHYGLVDEQWRMHSLNEVPHATTPLDI